MRFMSFLKRKPDYKKTRSITIGQFIDEIERNGYPQSFGVLYSTSDKSACAFGQGLINAFGRKGFSFDRYSLPEDANLFWSHLMKQVPGFYADAVHLNDDLHFSIPNIVKCLRVTYKDRLNQVISW